MKVAGKLNGFPHIGSQAPSSVVDSSAELLHMNVFRNIVHLSNDELERVTNLDEKLVALKDIIYFYYGREEGWCPVKYGTEMESRSPKGHVLIDDNGCEHAFVLRDGAVMAEKLLQMIQ